MRVLKSESEQVWGCHDLGVCDKVVLNLGSSPYQNRTLRHEITLIFKIHRRHGLVADSKTVAPIPQVGNLDSTLHPAQPQKGFGPASPAGIYGQNQDGIAVVKDGFRVCDESVSSQIGREARSQVPAVNAGCCE